MPRDYYDEDSVDLGALIESGAVDVDEPSARHDKPAPKPAKAAKKAAAPKTESE